MSVFPHPLAPRPGKEIRQRPPQVRGPAGDVLILMTFVVCLRRKVVFAGLGLRPRDPVWYPAPPPFSEHIKQGLVSPTGRRGEPPLRHRLNVLDQNPFRGVGQLPAVPRRRRRNMTVLLECRDPE